MHPSAGAVGQDPEVVAAAHAALDEHWALRSLPPIRRTQILAWAAARAAESPGAADPTSDAAMAPAATATRPARRRPAARGRPPALAPTPVSDADTLHLAGAYDLAGRDALAALAPLRPADPASALDDWSGELGALEARLEAAAGRAFALLAALPLDAPPADAEAPAADAGAPVLHRLLHLAALAEVGGRRAAWRRWMERHAAALAPHLPPALGPSTAGEHAPAWDARLRALVVAAWIELLRRSGPSGLDGAAALLARAREERDAREAGWLAAVEAEHGEVAAVRARFGLFALAHVGDAAVETLLYLRHGARHASAEAADRAVRRRLQLAREAGAGDVQLDGVLTWLREASRRVVGRGSPQLEIAVGD